jgi:co-chaperonin GroES (HSP10)
MATPTETQPVLKSLADCGYDSVDEAFPELRDHGFHPFSNYLLVQMRLPKKRTASGLILTSDIQDMDQYETLLGKVIGMGPLAFRNRQTMEPWPEGQWATVGSYVYCPKYTINSRFIPVGDEMVQIRFVKDTDLICGVDEAKVLNLTAYI